MYHLLDMFNKSNFNHTDIRADETNLHDDPSNNLAITVQHIIILVSIILIIAFICFNRESKEYKDEICFCQIRLAIRDILFLIIELIYRFVVFFFQGIVQICYFMYCILSKSTTFLYDKLKKTFNIINRINIIKIISHLPLQ